MKKINFIYNLILYFSYNIDNKISTSTAKLFNLEMLYKLVKNKQKRKNIIDRYNQGFKVVTTNIHIGLGIINAHIFVFFLFIFLQIATFNVLVGMLYNINLIDLYVNFPHYFIFVLILFLINFLISTRYILFKNKNYIVYFRYFNKLANNSKHKNNLIAAGFICTIIIIFFVSFYL